jgi:hypothetical protein
MNRAAALLGERSADTRSIPRRRKLKQGKIFVPSKDALEELKDEDTADKLVC